MRRRVSSGRASACAAARRRVRGDDGESELDPAPAGDDDADNIPLSTRSPRCNTRGCAHAARVSDTACRTANVSANRSQYTAARDASTGVSWNDGANRGVSAARASTKSANGTSGGTDASTACCRSAATVASRWLSARLASARCDGDSSGGDCVVVVVVSSVSV